MGRKERLFEKEFSLKNSAFSIEILVLFCYTDVEREGDYERLSGDQFYTLHLQEKRIGGSLGGTENSLYGSDLLYRGENALRL
jgi:hypothetical protein